MIAHSLLEHIVDQVQLLKNLSRTIHAGGVIINFMHNALMPMHRCSIDTLRFHTDFFLNLGKYASMTYEYCMNVGNEVHAIYRKPRN